jgi:glycolate oxidase FAD binding subunit
MEVLDEVIARGLWRGLADFGYDDATAPLAGARAFVQPSQVSDLVEALAQPSDEQTMPPSVVSHPAHGTVLVCWFRVDGEPSDDGLAGVLQAARAATHGLGGRMVIERCPAELKDRFDVWDEVGDSIAVMRRLKEQYDPTRTLNPGRFVGGI